VSSLVNLYRALE